MSEDNSRHLSELFANNLQWSEAAMEKDPDYFRRLTRQQQPRYLWIGCSDSRVPANQIIGLAPGEVFVHRNVANLVVHSDLNSLSVLQFAIDVFKVEHIMVVGHYGCGGVHAAMERRRVGLADNWLRHVEDTRAKHADFLDGQQDAQFRYNRLCELNVAEQVLNICRTTVMLEAWERGQNTIVHGLCYGLHDGLLRLMGTGIGSPEEVTPGYRQAIEQIYQTRTRIPLPACITHGKASAKGVDEEIVDSTALTRLDPPRK